MFALLCGGCAATRRPAPAPPLRGYVRLDALTRRHPGWSGVGRYDAALRRLEAAARALPPPDRPDEKIATLPALPAGPARPADALPPADIGREGARLTAVQGSLLDGLRGRRAMARAEQVAAGRSGWQRAARSQYPLPAGATAIQPDLEMQLLRTDIAALTQTVDSSPWKQAPAPAPVRETLQAKVDADRARLQELGAARVQARDAEQERQAAEVRGTLSARAAYAQAQADALESRLRSNDDRFLADQAGRLTRQRVALLGALARPAPVSVAGEAGAQTLPKGPDVGRAALARRSLTEAEAHLSAQRARWVGHLYDDTRASALDTAGRLNWDVTFGPPRPGDRDLTPRMVEAMRAGVWRL